MKLAPMNLQPIKALATLLTDGSFTAVPSNQDKSWCTGGVLEVMVDRRRLGRQQKSWYTG